MNDQPSRPTGLSRKELAFVALGLGAWVALAWGGVWFMHTITRTGADCGTAVAEPATRQAKGGATTGPRNALQLLTGLGRCK